MNVIVTAGLLACAALPATSAGQSGQWKWASGRVLGKPFTAVGAKLAVLGESTVTTEGKVRDRAQVYHLTLGSTNDFIPDDSVLIILQTDVKVPLSGKTFRMSGAKFGTDAYRAERFPRSNSVGRGVIGVHATINFDKNPRTEMWSDGYRGGITFGKAANGSQPGYVELQLPDGSTLKGSFVAKIEKY